MLLLNAAAAALAIVAGTAVQAATYNVEVGNGGNTFAPTTVTAVANDIVVFTFKGGSHTVTQSTFANPCSPLSGGVDSGPQAVAGTTTPPVYNYTVNGTEPAWFYCKTGTHCKGGMVFAINPTAEKTYDAFKANAQGGGTGNGTASASGSSAPSSTASGSTAPAATSKAAANGRATVGIGAVAAALLFGGVNAI